MNRRLAEGISADAPRAASAAVDAVIALGSNLGDRALTIGEAVDDLRRLPLVDEVRVSTGVESVALRPDGPDDSAPTFVNAVAIVRTRLAPSVLLAYLHAIEERHGRDRRERWGDRTLDLDIVTYGGVRSADPALTLPHPRAHERDFVLAPWLALDPYAELPDRGRVDDLLTALRGAT